MHCIAQIAIHLFKDNRGSIFVEEAVIVLNNRFPFVHHQYHNLVPHDSFLPLLLHFDSLAKHEPVHLWPLLAGAYKDVKAPHSLGNRRTDAPVLG